MENNKKSFWTLFKEIWQNKRYRSLIILGLYGIFFIFVFMFLNNNQSEPLPEMVKEEPKTTLENYRDLNNYQFILEINEIKDKEEADYSYNGKTNDEITLINDKFFLKTNVIYEIVNNQIKPLEASLVDINLFKLKPANLYELINLGELNYETKFADESIEKSYLVPLRDVIKNFKGEDIADQKATVEIKYKEKDNNIISVELDLSSYQKHFYEMIDKYFIKISYSNIGNVETLKDYKIVTSS